MTVTQESLPVFTVANELDLDETTTELAGLIARGNASSAQENEFFANLQEPLMRGANRTVGPNDREDVAQDAALGVWLALRKKSDFTNGNIMGYAQRAAYNSGIDHIRKENRQPLTIDGELDPNQHTAPHDTASEAIDKVRLGELGEALVETGIDPDFLEAVWLKYAGDLDQNGVARIQNVELGTAKSRINRGMRALRESSVMREFAQIED